MVIPARTLRRLCTKEYELPFRVRCAGVERIAVTDRRAILAVAPALTDARPIDEHASRRTAELHLSRPIGDARVVDLAALRAWAGEHVAPVRCANKCRLDRRNPAIRRCAVTSARCFDCTGGYVHAARPGFIGGVLDFEPRRNALDCNLVAKFLVPLRLVDGTVDVLLRDGAVPVVWFGCDAFTLVVACMVAPLASTIATLETRPAP